MTDPSRRTQVRPAPSFGRSGVRRVVPASTRAPLPRVPRLPPLPPGAGNAARGLAGAARVAGRLLPWLGLALTAYELWRWWQSQSNYPNLTNWVREGECATTPGYDGTPYKWSNHGTGNACPGSFRLATPFPSSPFVGQRIGYGKWKDSFPSQPNNVWEEVHYRYVGPTNPDAPNMNPAPQPPFNEPVPLPPQDPAVKPSPLEIPTVPGWVPWIDPGALPPLAPQPAPWMPPMPAIPSRPGQVSPPGQEGNEPGARLRRRLPRRRNETEEGVSLDPRRGVRRQPGQRHAHRPPPPGEKETKLIGQIPPGLLKKVLGEFTEFVDFVNCLRKGLPDGGSRRVHTIQDALQELWNRAGEIDFAKAAAACIQNEIEDYFYGRVGRVQARVNRRLNLTAGLGRTQGNINKATKGIPN